MSDQSVGESIFGRPDCQHGVKWGVECLECQIQWYTDCRKDAQMRVISCTTQIEGLYTKLINQRDKPPIKA